MSKKIRVLLCTVFAAMMLAALMGLAACSSESNDEEQIESIITEVFDEVKNADDEALNMMAEGASEDDLATMEQYGISSDDYFRSFFDGFDYSIDSVTVDGDTATVEITYTSKTMGTFYSAINDIDTSSITSDSDVGTALLSALDNAEVITYGPVSATLTKEDGTWDTEANGNALAEAWAQAMASN